MPSKIVIDGHLRWIIPLLLIIATASFTLYTIYPTYEYFSSDNKLTVKESKTDTSKIELNKLEKEMEELKEKISKHTGKDKEDIKVSKPENVKENFETYTTSAGILGKNWMNEKSPKTLEKYNGSIKGYNCSEYSEYTLNTPLDNNECTPADMRPPTSQEDYIFPGRPVNKTNCIKYAAKPNILGYENDVNDKILQHESLNILNDYKPEYLNIDRPQFMYNRRSGTTDPDYPIITDENRFEVGALNTVQKRTAEYSIE